MPFSSVLIVDDSADDVLLTRRALAKLSSPPEVTSFYDPVEAMGYLVADETSIPDLLLLDIRMPKISGFEFLDMLRSNEKTAHMCAVMLTSSGESPDLTRARELKANSYLVKPVEPDHYLRIIDTFAARWLESGECPEFWPDSA